MAASSTRARRPRHQAAARAGRGAADGARAARAEDKKIRALRGRSVGRAERARRRRRRGARASFREDSAYYSICDPKQKRYAFTVLGVMAMLYVMLGVLPLLEDEREDNHPQLRRAALQHHRQRGRRLLGRRWYLGDDEHAAGHRRRASAASSRCVAFCVIAAFADNLEPCLRSFHESIVNDKDSLEHSWFLLRFFAIATRSAWRHHH